MSKVSPRPKGQHYIPKMVLEKFVGSSPKNMVWVYDLEARVARPSKPQGTGKQTNLYSPVGPDGERIDTLEAAFSDIEGLAKKPYDNLLDGIIPVEEDRQNLSIFIATQYLRSPKHIRSVAEGEARMMHAMMMMQMPNEEAMASVFEEMGAPKTKRELSEQLAFLQDPSKYNMNIHLQRGLMAMVVAPDIAELLNARRWYVFRTASSKLVTTDNPVVRYVPEKYVSDIYGDGGFANEYCEVSMPLSPNALLTVASSDLPEGMYDIDDKNVERLNLWRIQNCDRYFFASEKTKENLEFLENVPDRNELRLSVGGISDTIAVNVKREM